MSTEFGEEMTAQGDGLWRWGGKMGESSGGSWGYAWDFGSTCGERGIKEFREQSQLRKLSLEV